MAADEHTFLFFPQINIFSLQTRITDVLSYLLSILGIIGNLLGLLVFSLSHRAWRRSSIYVCLATCSSIINAVCVLRYGSILHSKLRNILLDLVGQKWWACKIYEFSYSFRVISSWITLFWMFERLICVSSRLQTPFRQWKSLKLVLIIPILTMIIILGYVVGLPVYMFQPHILEYANISLCIDLLFDSSRNKILNSTLNQTRIYCGLDPNTSVEWQKYFHDAHFGRNHRTIRCLFSELIPAMTIILCNTYIIRHLIQRHQNLRRTSGASLCRKQARTTSWMNLVLVVHSLLFLSSLFAHIVGHFTSVEGDETWWVSLTVLLNCSLNFYVYCLSGKAFRNEIHLFARQMLDIFQNLQRRCCCRETNQLDIYEARNHRTSHRLIVMKIS